MLYFCHYVISGPLGMDYLYSTKINIGCQRVIQIHFEINHTMVWDTVLIILWIKVSKKKKQHSHRDIYICRWFTQLLINLFLMSSQCTLFNIRYAYLRSHSICKRIKTSIYISIRGFQYLIYNLKLIYFWKITSWNLLQCIHIS